MLTRSKLLLAGLTAAFILSMAVAGASATHLSVSNTSFTATWTSLELESSAGTVRCPITMEGTFHSATIVKTIGSLIGYVARATVDNAACSGGHATVSQEALPWHVQYGGFTGTLPRITGVILNLINAKFRVEIGGLSCTTTTTQTNPARGIALVEPNHAITGLRADETTLIPLRGSFLCEISGSGNFRGTGSVRLTGRTTSISVTLI